MFSASPPVRPVLPPGQFLRSAELLSKSDEKPFRPADVAEEIRVFILDYFAYELRAALTEPFKCLVDVVHGEHDAEVAQSVHRGLSVIRDNRRRDEAGELDPAVAVRRAHHGYLDALFAQSSDTSSPFSFDRSPPFELEAEFEKEIDRRSEVIDDDSYVVHPFDRHVLLLGSSFFLLIDTIPANGKLFFHLPGGNGDALFCPNPVCAIHHLQ